ncbi:MAG TPA: hypothetical protein VE988_04895 [Gemmataceae bacterium]|nr:hypothetical protein [Gemmataceae bacterium]
MRTCLNAGRTTAHAYKANANEREIWPETPKLIEGRTFLSGDLAPILEMLRERILRELGLPPASPPEQTGGNGQINTDVAAIQDDSLTDRHELILETMLANEITSERRRKTRVGIVGLINRTHKPAKYSRDFAKVAKLDFLKCREGVGGGVWLTPKGKAEAGRLRTSNQANLTVT